MDQISGFVVAISDDDEYFMTSSYYSHPKLLATAKGGRERFHSVLNALNTLIEFTKDDDWVLVHDAVRPCIKKEDVERLISELQNQPIGGILAVEVVDTLKKVGNEDFVRTIERNKLYQAQTPQMFRIGLLKQALEKVVEDNDHITDEAEAIERLGHSIKIVLSSKSNIKITHSDDLKLANYYLNKP
jgi:2-C-methyl-D-erythritol 4-phosphate cytidylyltransferase